MSFIAIGFRAGILLMITVVIIRKRLGGVISFLGGVAFLCLCLVLCLVINQATKDTIDAISDHCHIVRSKELIRKVPRPVLEHVVFGNNTAGFYAAVTGSPVDFHHLGNFTASTVHSGVQAVSLLLSEELDLQPRDLVLQFLATRFGAGMPDPRTRLTHLRFREVLEARMARDQ